MNCELNNLANETKETIYFSYLDEKTLGSNFRTSPSPSNLRAQFQSYVRGPKVIFHKV